MQYRGYFIEPVLNEDQPTYSISDAHGPIDHAPSHVEAERIIDHWVDNAR